MKTVLISGGAGFIGTHLTRSILDDGDRVICLDNLFTGSKGNIQQFQMNPNYRFILHDIIDPIDLDDEMIDEIYNLACPASPVHYQHDPIRTILASTVGVRNMLELAKKHKARILQASTSEVYGDPLEHPQKESYKGNVSTIGPRACYDEGKRVAETLFFDYHRQSGVDIAVARFFNTYGPNMAKNDGRVVSNFIIQALAGKDIPIAGEGIQTRSFCYVSDLIIGIRDLMAKKGFTGPINLGNPGEFTIKELADKVIHFTNSRSRIVHVPLPMDDPRQRKPDITLAKEVLGWSPKILLDEGLQKTIPYFKQII